MLEAATYRGPDGRNAWHEGPIALGHLMLWTTPESLHERLPLVDSTARLAIAADARIDNRAELIPALELTERARDGLSDSAIILAAYARWGEDCVSHLLGDFAFAIWDERNRRLFCARDHFGIKPLYYSHQNALFAFASDIKALLCLGWVSRELDEESVAGYLVTLFEEDRTVYRDVCRLPPAHTLVCDETGVTLRRYWALDPTRELRLRSDEEYAEAFRELFTEAVRCRLRSAYPVGSTLSGGLDSSSVTCVARNVLQQEGNTQRLHTFSATFERFPSCDEQTYIRTVLAEGGIEGHLVPVDCLSPWQAYLDSVPLDEGPYPGMTFYVVWGAYRAAQEHGVRVVLTGHCGDSVVSHGYDLLDHLARHGRWISLWREVKALLPEGVPMGRAMKGIFVDNSPRWMKVIWRRMHGITDVKRLLGDVPIAPEFAERTGVLARLRAADRFDSACRSPREQHCLGIVEPLFTLGFEADGKLASSYTLESRHPFFDRRLVEFCVALPQQQKLRQGWTRYVLRRAMQGILPEAIRQRRTKSNLSPCFDHHMYHTDRQRLLETIESSKTRLSAIVSLRQLAELQRKCFSEEAGVGRYWKPVWTAAALAAWLSSNDTIAPQVQEGSCR
jgi:asparagine synthase (glutamine-hydrolysing)